MKPLIVSLVIFLLTATLEASELSLPTRDLDSTNITYNYTSGRSYNVKFEEKGVSYRYLTGSKPDKWWGPFPYQAFKVEDEVYLTSWFEEGYGDYVTLLINFNNNLLYGSAILSGKTVHFHGAKIVTAARK
jgi:phenolic acid decarboxylase